jgi:hypothetical protein
MKNSIIIFHSDDGNSKGNLLALGIEHISALVSVDLMFAANQSSLSVPHYMIHRLHRRLHYYRY